MTYLSPKNNPFIGSVADLPAKAWLGHEPSEIDTLALRTSLPSMQEDDMNSAHICYDDNCCQSTEHDHGGPNAAARGILNGLGISFLVCVFVVVAVVVLNGGAYNLINRNSAAHTGTQTAKTAEGGAR